MWLLLSLAFADPSRDAPFTLEGSLTVPAEGRVAERTMAFSWTSDGETVWVVGRWTHAAQPQYVPPGTEGLAPSFHSDGRLWAWQKKVTAASYRRRTHALDLCEQKTLHRIAPDGRRTTETVASGTLMAGGAPPHWNEVWSAVEAADEPQRTAGVHVRLTRSSEAHDPAVQAASEKARQACKPDDYD